MIAAFQRKQQTEALHTAALLTALVNPDRAYDAYMTYLQSLMPEYRQIRQNLDQRLIGVMSREMDKVFRIRAMPTGWSMREEKLTA
jgi:flagellar biosynthesis chaperone FliJ